MLKKKGGYIFYSIFVNHPRNNRPILHILVNPNVTSLTNDQIEIYIYYIFSLMLPILSDERSVWISAAYDIF